jgi:anti-sigma factor RsiW
LNCRKVNNLLSAYMDGELPGIESLQIRDHLNACNQCAEDYNQLLHMKRLLGRMKVQAPAHNMPERIFQTIRVDSQLASQRSLNARVHEMSAAMRFMIAAPRTLAVGLGTIGAVVVLASVRNDDHVHSVSFWDHSTPPASEFTVSIKYPDPQRFVSTPSRITPGIRMVDDISLSGQAYPFSFSNHHSSPSPVAPVDYITIGR